MSNSCFYAAAHLRQRLAELNLQLGCPEVTPHLRRRLLARREELLELLAVALEAGVE